MIALSIENLRKTYPNGFEALKGINFKVQEGDFFALLGPNGAGKSTTIGIITSLTNKTSGKVTVFDYDIDTNFADAKACIGLVPQEFNAFMFEKIHQVLLNQAGYYGVPRKIAMERTEKYLTKLSLWDKRNDIVRNLSGGMKRRLMIARALVNEPKLLILDEPTAGVDIEVRRSMWQFLQEINANGTTVILTTHYLEEAENLCRNIAIIHQGSIVENTSMKELLKTLNVESFVLNLQHSLAFPPELSGFTCRLLDEVTLEIDVHKDQAINDVFAQLSAQRISVVSLRNKANRLEELFLGLISKNDT